jgi:hypothetical protein
VGSVAYLRAIAALDNFEDVAPELCTGHFAGAFAGQSEGEAGIDLVTQVTLSDARAIPGEEPVTI